MCHLDKFAIHGLILGTQLHNLQQHRHSDIICWTIVGRGQKPLAGTSYLTRNGNRYRHGCVFQDDRIKVPTLPQYATQQYHSVVSASKRWYGAVNTSNAVITKSAAMLHLMLAHVMLSAPH